MSRALSSPSPRRLVALFLVLTLAPAAGLVWLGWRLLEQDRTLETQRAQERREHAADVVTGALNRELPAARQRLSEPLQTPALDSAQDVLIVVFRGERVEALPAGRLLFQPFLAPGAQPAGDPFRPGEQYEFQHRDYASAIGSFRLLAASPDPAVRAGARLRIARNHRKAGNPRLALAAYEELARSDGVSIAGVPAELVARRARCALLAEMSRSEELRREAGTLYRGLLSGRWQLTRAVYELHAAQAREWLGAADDHEGEQLALSGAVEWLWGRWQAARAGSGAVPETSTVRLRDRCLTILSRAGGETLAALIAGPRYVEAQWLAPAVRAIGSRNLRVHLRDASGNAVHGKLAADSGRQSIRLASDTGLPWTVVVANTGSQPEAEQLVSRRLLLAGLALALTLVFTSSYLIGRTVSRELAVARLKSEFVSAVSHEFRTPLATLRQLTENLADGRVTTEERREAYFHAQGRATNRLHRLVERLLDFGRMEAGALRYRPEPVDLGQLARAVVEEFEHVAATSGHRIEVTTDPSLPQVRADPEALGQALWNLLDNAIKYSPGRPAVRVEVVREGEFAAIRVRDQGFGIPPQERKRLFRKFVRGSAAQAADVKGTGIGLAMVDHVVRAHGGRIRVESAPGQGSTFSVLLKMKTS